VQTCDVASKMVGSYTTETLRTLQFAAAAKSVRERATVNVDATALSSPERAAEVKTLTAGASTRPLFRST